VPGPLRPHTDARTKLTGKDFRRAPILRRFPPWPAAGQRNQGCRHPPEKSVVPAPVSAHVRRKRSPSLERRTRASAGSCGSRGWPDLADYSRHAPRHARDAHFRHPRHTCPAQPCGFLSAMRVNMGEVGFRPPCKSAGSFRRGQHRGQHQESAFPATVLLVAVRLGRSEQRELDALPSRLTEHRSPRRSVS
jgi:hypothetical protein